MRKMKTMKMSLMIFTASLFVISCGNGQKDKQKIKIQSHERSNEPSKELADLQQMDDDVEDVEKSAKEESDISTSEENKNSSAVDNKSKDEVSTDQENVVELYLTGNDKMKYNKEELKVKAGSTVKLVFEHVGKMSVQTMGHNFVLLKQGVDKIAFGQEASSYASDGYIPPNTDKVIAHTEMLGGGKKTTITFEAPPKGTYDYICSFPGHVALMNGKFIVE